VRKIVIGDMSGPGAQVRVSPSLLPSLFTYRLCPPHLATIALGALRNNLAVARARAALAVLAVIKATLCHGLLRAARAMRDADGFACSVRAAAALRDAGYTQRIVMLKGFDARDLRCWSSTSSAPSSQRARSSCSGIAGRLRLDVLLKINTGMNRLGLRPRVSRGAAALQPIPPRADHAHDHFATPMTSGASPGRWRRSTGLRGPDAAALPRQLGRCCAIRNHCDWTRPGIMLYGCSPFPGVPAGTSAEARHDLSSEIIATASSGARQRRYGGMFSADGTCASASSPALCRRLPAPRAQRHAGPPSDGRLTGNSRPGVHDMLCGT